jgi:uncharacterized protein YdhG (YjbR/CyaY superfamily)
MSKRDETDANDVDRYLEGLAEEPRKALEKLRKQIRAAAPGAGEGLSYGIPAFKLGGRPLVAYASLSKHCSFFPMSPAVLEAHLAQLEGFETSKGTIRFQVDKPLPAALVKKIVKARIAELEAS